MESNEIAAIGYTTAMVVLGLLTVLLLSRWKRRDRSQLLAGATGASVLWSGVLALQSLGYLDSIALTLLVEWLRYGVWLAALTAVLRELDPTPLLKRLAPKFVVPLLVVVGVPILYHVMQSSEPPAEIGLVASGFLLSMLVLIVVEQVYRNAPADLRQGLGYLCVALVGVFAYDLLVYVARIAGFAVDPKYWTARGFVNAMLTVPLGVGIRRAYRLSFHVAVPRQVVFYAFGLTAIGIYIVLTATGHYYVRTYGGSWSAVAGVVFLTGAIAFVGVLLASSSTRRRVRVVLMKAFFQYKYDYRKEWLRFIATLSESGLENVPATAVRAVGQIVDSPGGIVWAQEHESMAYLPIGSWHCEIPALPPMGPQSGLVRFLKDRQWVIDLEEMKRHPLRYEDLQLEGWVTARGEWWLIVPLFLGTRLFGFILLLRPRIVPDLNFEDHDLLRTVGRHVAMHINQAEVDRRLAESSQFGTYNRLTAFLMHDLNNLIAQQSLVVQNADKFRQNPKFVDDAIETIAHSVLRMRRLMEQLTRSSTEPARRRTDLQDALTSAIARCESRHPVPTFTNGADAIYLHADPERLTTSFEHLIRNAQDATPTNGMISVDVEVVNGTAKVSIRDTGAGMTPEFIRERLFRPFDSTKGSQSMGIGAYQAREYVRSLGGQLDVASTVGAGTTFSVQLPLNE